MMKLLYVPKGGIFMPQNMQYVDGRMELSYEDTKCDKMYHFCWQN